jgi:hypothetical protein
MSTIALERPGGRTGQVITGAMIGTDAGDKFTMKVFEGTHSFSVPTADVTGDGDNATCILHNGLKVGRFNFVGAMVASEAVGVDNLGSTTANTATVMVFYLGGNQALTYKVIVSDIVIRSQRRGVFVGVALRGFMTETSGSTAIETT